MRLSYPFQRDRILAYNVLGVRVGRRLGLLERAAVGEFHRPILTAVGTIFQRVPADGDLVARLYGVRLPALGSDHANRTHLKRPFDVAAASRALGTLMNGDASQRDFVNKSLQPLFETRVAAFQKYWRELFDAPDQEAWWTYYLARHARHPKRKV